MHIIEFSTYCAYYKTKSGLIKALDKLSFSIDTGEIFVVVGDSGSGKTTLLKTVLGQCEYSDTKLDKSCRLSLLFVTPDRTHQFYVLPPLSKIPAELPPRMHKGNIVTSAYSFDADLLQLPIDTACPERLPTHHSLKNMLLLQWPILSADSPAPEPPPVLQKTFQKYSPAKNTS